MCVDPTMCRGTCTECNRGVSLTDCHACNGTGIDDADWSGRCARCGCYGLVEENGPDLTDDELEDYNDG